MWILLGGNALNIVGNYVLIYGKCGFPELGLLGAGLSTLLSRIVMVVVFAWIVLRARRFRRYRVGLLRQRWSSVLFRRLNALGWPVGLQMGMETASFSLSIIMVGWLGTIALASHQIMLTISQFTFMMFYGMGAAVAVRVSNYHGVGDVQNVRRTANAGFHLILLMAVVLLSIVFACRYSVAGWFTDSAEVAALVVWRRPANHLRQCPARHRGRQADDADGLRGLFHRIPARGLPVRLRAGLGVGGHLDGVPLRADHGRGLVLAPFP